MAYKVCVAPPFDDTSLLHPGLFRTPCSLCPHEAMPKPTRCPCPDVLGFSMRKCSMGLTHK